ncbi:MULTISPECIES: efflux RND transporter periplasmic adaptor subunit [Sphingobium]|jgi:membrane fusion protein, multidrug efflux system|uniref:efflux RND transporter periplasmic adaptor subunit n=1 Tax=Sphingobium TaxID=165695 RepID=UPI000C5C5184|nr:MULTISPECIES: efflux RND transporter periplasmic adaptor subunit [Sphingobium]MBA37359.1 efflux transporter periplasmic adaptor subunit [Sphingobium sp.]MBS47996.1 efflux transporter periplasmic adaptor subunit [Sphingobium sp.]MCC4255530.1 efflux RND transporter periplasmic adaptor subunit [Sphingobium lactosutens]HCW59679.1 efflux transporter periplasmic adaptor subunit [Sphingobium sp.]|tara:strand:- start:817 stop:1866 length:1050 start_codon:yes stop_codon:yes gene_type:complete
MRLILPLFLSALCLAGCSGEEQKPQRAAPLVTVKPIGTATFTDRVEAVGTALANEQVVLSAPVTERIDTVNFADGGFVSRGQVIATMAVAQEKAELAAAQAQARQAGQQLERIQALKTRGFATAASLDQQLALANAAKAAADQSRAAISDRVIRAPFGGWVSLRTISPGAIIPAGTAIATVSDISRIKLDFAIPETQLSMIREGIPIDAVSAAWPDRPFKGTIATIDPVIDPATRAVRVRAILPNGDKALKPGMLLTVSVQASQRESLAVPELAVVGDGEDRYVFALDGRTAKRVKVDTGMRQNGMVEIVGGLKAGQPIVTEGVVKLSDGATVRLAGDKPQSGAAKAKG